MSLFRIASFVLLLNIFYCKLNAQQTSTADSLRIDSNQQVTEVYLIQKKNEQKTDSMISVQLQNELVQTENAEKRKELEQKLKNLLAKDSLRNAERLQRLDNLKKVAVGYPVVLLNDTLFYIYTSIGSFSAQKRAAAISDRIENLYNDVLFSPDSLSIQQNELTRDLIYKKDNIILSVTDLDALWYNKTSAALADEYVKKIRTTIMQAKEDNSFSNWLHRIGYSLLTVLGALLIIFGLSRLFRYFERLLYLHRDKYFKGITIRNVKILSPTQHYTFAIQVNKLARIVVIILALYLVLPLLFSIFPQTKPFADTLLNWIAKPAKSIFDSFIKFLPNLFTILVIYLVTNYLVRIVKYFTNEIDKGSITLHGFYKEWAHPTFNILRVLIYAFMFVLIFPYLPGSGSPIFQGVTVFLGVLVSLGSSSAIANLVAGIVITYMRPFKIGDRIKIGDVVGDVIEKTMLITRVRTIKNEDITVPNSNILSSHTINYSVNAADTGLILHTTVTIGYDVPWKDVHQALIDAALRTDLVLKEPLPFVLQTSLDDFYVSYQLNVYTREALRQSAIYSELHKNIQDVFNERGIEIMSPHYAAVRDGNTTTIPADHLAKDYKAPSFNVHINKQEKDV